MATGKNSLSELVAALREGTLKLPALFDALTQRGAVDAEQHAREVAWLEKLRDEDGFDPRIVRALLGKLAVLQPEPPTPVDDSSTPDDDDATRLQPDGPRTHDSQDTANESSGHEAPTAPEDDGTVVRASPPSGAAEDDSATIVHPPSRPDATSGHTGTGTSGSPNTSTWQRMAAQDGGEYATVGMVLKGRFLLERELGRGGMGVVYLARDERKVEARDRDPYVAVKVLNDEFRRHPDSLIALQRESRRSQRLAHDNIVRVYDFDKDGTIVFMTMEYIDGTNLKALIREDAYDGMSLDRARPLIEGMVRALARAHAGGVVHSDFKPGNVMVTAEGVPKVFDFGIARAGKHLDEAGGELAGEETVFDAGTLGALTPAYASLEMLRGAEPTPADDIYALGCVIYELLTGKHPFDKVNAEKALEEGRKPPWIRGLTKQQNRVLRRAVAFRTRDRLHDASSLLGGLREVGWRERMRPLLVYGAIVVVALVLAGWGTRHYLQVRRIDTVVARFAPDNPRQYASEDQAMLALEELGADARKRVVVDHSGAIQAFLLSRLHAYWNPAKDQYNYAGVRHVLRIRNRLKLFAPKIDVARAHIDDERNAALNKLDSELSERMAAGAIFENQKHNVVEVLDKIRAIDPHSELLDNAQLKLKYDVAVGKSLDAGDLDRAGRQLTLARKLFPDSKRLHKRADQLAAAEGVKPSVAEGLAAGKADVPDARKALAKLLAHPSLSRQWQARVAASLTALQSDQSPETEKLRQALGDTIAGQAADASEPGQVRRAASLVAMGLEHMPQSKKLIAQRKRLDGLQEKMQAKLAQASAAAEVTSRIESVKRAAAAHDIAKASAALARIRKLQPDNEFLSHQGPQLLAKAYLGEAESLMDRGRYDAAARLLDKGLSAAGNRSDLRQARDRDAFVADLMRARKQMPNAAGIRRLRKRLAALRQTDASAMQALAARLKRRGDLRVDSFEDVVAALKPSASGHATATAPATVRTSPGTGAEPETELAHVAGHAGPKAAEQANHESTSSETEASVATPTANPVAKSKKEAKSAQVAQTDRCARPGLAGRGRTCWDMIDGARGPALVVIPGMAGKHAYAMSRTEITVGQFNRFCQATGKCRPAQGGARLPVRDISIARAKAYVAWLTKTSGHVYRLPTDQQWMHAAQAGDGWSQSPDSNCIPPAAGGGSGGGPIPARGRQPNPWGLVNMTGNVWEWVLKGGTAMVRGGSYDSYWSECTVASHRRDSGKAQDDVGFRIVRQL